MRPDEVSEQKLRFNDDPRCRVILLQCDASKYGHTLCLQPDEDKCRTMIFFENSYSADVRDQIEDRIHRRGQTGESVLYIDLSGSDLDRRIVKALQRKDELYKSVFRNLRASTPADEREGKGDIMKRLLMATALAGVFAGPAMAANVALTMWTDGSDAVTESGTIGFTVGNENLDGMTVDTTFALRGITSKQLTEGNVNIDNTTGSIQTLHLIVGASGFGGPDSAFKLTGSILNASGANSLSGGYFIDPTNTLNGLGMSVVGTQIGSFASGVLGDAESFSFNGVGVFAVLGNYGMAEN